MCWLCHAVSALQKLLSILAAQLLHQHPQGCCCAFPCSAALWFSITASSCDCGTTDLAVAVGQRLPAVLSWVLAGLF